MGDEEVGRWTCEKCGKGVVVAGRRLMTFKGIGAFTGPCPWECGGWINRGFRWIKPGQAKAFRDNEWDQRPRTP